MMINFIKIIVMAALCHNIFSCDAHALDVYIERKRPVYIQRQIPFWGLYGDLNTGRIGAVSPESINGLDQLPDVSTADVILSIASPGGDPAPGSSKAFLLIENHSMSSFRQQPYNRLGKIRSHMIMAPSGFLGRLQGVAGRLNFNIREGSRDQRIRGNLQILSALYGDLNLSTQVNSVIHVGDMLRKNIRDNKINLGVQGQSMSQLFGDPSPGLPKGLIVFYRVGMNVYVKLFNENQPCVISAEDSSGAFLLQTQVIAETVPPTAN